MKKTISILFATIMLLSTMFIGTTAFADPNVTPKQVDSFTELEANQSKYLASTMKTNVNNDTEYRLLTFTLPEKAYVYIKTAESIENNKNGMINLQTKVYDTNYQKCFYQSEKIYNNNIGRLLEQYSRVLLEPGTYSVYVNVYDYGLGDNVSTSAYIGYRSASKELIQVDYLGQVNNDYNYKFKITSPDGDKITEMKYNDFNTNNEFSYDACREINFDSENCVTIKLSSYNHDDDVFITFGTKDVYGQTIVTKVVLLSDQTATVEGISDVNYTGSPITLPLTVKAGGFVIDYVATYENNVQPGTATVTISGSANNDIKVVGSVTRTFNIIAPAVQPTQPSQTPTQPSTTPNVPSSTTPSVQPTTSTATKVSKPKATKIKKVKGSKKAVATTWTKISGVKGYQVQVATDKKFKKNKKTVTIKKQKTTSTTVKKLKAKTKYYVRVRTYKTVNGKNVYSSWSSVKSVKTK